MKESQRRKGQERPRTRRVDGAPGSVPPARSEPAAPEAAIALAPAVQAAQPIGWDGAAVATILAAALAVRLLGLGVQPLQEGEAASAWQSWSILRSGEGSASSGPALVFGNALVFFLFGASDATARLLSALVGTAMVALPLLLQRELGRIGSRVAMLLLAVSPSLVYHSRHADGAIFAAAAALGLVTWGAAARRDGKPEHLYASAACAGLLLVSGPVAFYAVVVLGLFLIARPLVPALARPPQDGTPPGPESAEPLAPFGRDVLIRAGLLGAATWLVVTTGFLTDLHGVQEGLFDGVAGWLAALTTASGRTAIVYAAVLVLQEPAALLFGLLGAAHFARKGNRLAALLGWWALATLALGALSQGRPAELAPQIVAPLALLAGAYVDHFVPELRDRRFRVDLAWLALGGVVVLFLLVYALSHVTTPAPYVPDAIVALPLGLVALALAAAAQVHGVSRALRLLRALALVLLLLLTWRATSLLTFGEAASPGEVLVGTATSPDVRALASDVSEALDALADTRPERSVFLAASLETPLRWYLRGSSNVTISDSVDGAPGGEPGVTILPVGAPPPRSGYAGQQYRVASVGQLDFERWKDLWRWVAFREAPRAPAVVDAVVYVRSARAR